MKNKTLIIVFLIILYAVFIFVPFKEVLLRLGLTSYYPSDNWKTVEKSNNKIYDKIMTLEAFPFNANIIRTQRRTQGQFTVLHTLLGLKPLSNRNMM